MVADCSKDPVRTGGSRPKCKHNGSLILDEVVVLAGKDGEEGVLVADQSASKQGSILVESGVAAVDIGFIVVMVDKTC